MINGVGEERKRKMRSDKKRDVKPTVPLPLYECISRISYITVTPMKDVAEYLCVRGLEEREVIEVLSKRFRRKYRFKNTLFIGKPERVAERSLKIGETKRRISIRFPQSIHDQIAELAYSLDVTVSTATALLLDAAAKHAAILDDYISRHVVDTLEPFRKKQLKEVIRYLKKDNPYGEEITLARLISYIIEEVMDHTVNAKRAVESWLDQTISGKTK
ncbi:hypothetical protein [Caldibacillus debilis]|uniref:Uncharacterized protein n=1 Tax=Caldibacillus debilis GB1 TaxID=1339248 RepID=A0A420VDB4_9BACI|nr:hypothetical protein [Caldibacillus debilis]RKO61662.1 hypothetical protein Cdeb_01133 [Caldibacillus debilis GB1]